MTNSVNDTTLVRVPDCFTDTAHGQMVRRPLERQTYEQRFCGIWFDCVTCGSTKLLPSVELQDDLNRQRAEVGDPIIFREEIWSGFSVSV